MQLVWGLCKSRDASQPVNLWIVYLRNLGHGQNGLLRPKMDGKYLESGNATDMFLTRFNFLRASIITMSLIPSIRAQELGLPKIGQNRNQVVFGKSDLTG